MVRTVRPKANPTPRNPMPRPGYAADSTALPHPPNTSQNVPIASATNFLPNVIYTSLGLHMREFDKKEFDSKKLERNSRAAAKNILSPLRPGRHHVDNRCENHCEVFMARNLRSTLFFFIGLLISIPVMLAQTGESFQ